MKEYMKENIKNNKTRIVIWSIIAFLTITFSISGSILFNNGHGTVGSIRIKLIPIAKEFNRLDAVIRNGNIKAECNGKELVVTYKDKTFNIDEKFVYSFGTEEDTNYITNTYSDSNSERGDFIAINMIEAIYKLNKDSSEENIKVSDKYRISSFGATSVKDGAEYTNKEEIVTVKLNIKTNIIKNAVALKIDTIQDTDHFHADELADMMESLEKQRWYTKTKRDTTVYIKKDDVYYEVFFSFSDKEIMLRSASNIVKIIKPDLYKKLDNETGILDFSTISNEFRIIENVNFSEPGIFKKNENIYELILYN